MGNRVNRQILLAARPVGMIKESDCTLREAPVRALAEGEFLVRNVYLSLDPTIRGWMNEADTYLPAIKIGDVMRGYGVGVVEESRNPQYPPGTIVLGMIGWQDYTVGPGGGAMPMNVLPPGVPLMATLSVFGGTGMTAYFGLLDVGQPKAGETVLVSGAAGAVGSIVGQIAKIKGARAVGIAGGPDKCRYVKDALGFDDCLDHRAPDFAARLKAVCPKGIDVYFENVGGAVFDAVLPLLNPFARIPVCGLIAHYNATELPPGPNRLPLLMRNVLTKRLLIRGFIVTDFAARFEDFIREMSQWVKEGRIKYREDIAEGLDSAPATLIGLLKGKNFGKQLMRVAD